MQLVIGNKNYSSWSLRPWLLLKVHSIDFEEIQVSLLTENLRQSLRDFSPAAKVPVLIDNGITVWDSLAICEYISEKYLQDLGWPGSIEARTQCRAVSAEMHAGFACLRAELPMNCRLQCPGGEIALSAAAKQDIDRIDEIWSDLRRANAPFGEWLFGNFSIADAMYAPIALRFFSYSIALSPASHAYMATVLANGSIKQWMVAAAAETDVLAQFEK